MSGIGVIFAPSTKKEQTKKNMKALITSIMVSCLLLCGCNQHTGKQTTEPTEEDSENFECCCPPTILLQPLGDFSQAEAKRLQKELTARSQEIFGLCTQDLCIEILPAKPLTANLMNSAKSRYRGDKIINWLGKEADNHRVIIALTHKDISVSYKGKADWGVLGLSLSNSYACVVSTYRLKDQRDLWKLTAHEYRHTYNKQKHCPDNVPTCIMQDANGHANFSIKTGFCKKCLKGT